MSRKHRILIVHEPDLVRDFRAVFGGARRYVVRGESDPIQGENAVAEFKPDLILTDASVKGIDGKTLACRLRNDPRFSEIPIVFFTGFVSAGETKDFEGFPALGRPAWFVEMEGFIQTHLPKQPANSLATADKKTLLDREKPIRLFHCLQGWPPNGPNGFRWKEDHLDYSLSDLSIPHRDWKKVMVPTVSQWQQFWRICDEIDVWSWPLTLGDLNVIDGLQWKTILEVGDLCVESEGQVSGSPIDFEEKLKRLHYALQEMTGWRPNDNDWGG